jgi:hypothetical protein
MEGSDISSDTLKSFEAVKTTLTGDYSHKHKALDKALEYLRVNHLRPDKAFSHLEIYSIGKNDIKNPSKWITEIYNPTSQNFVYKPAVTSPTATEEEIPKVKKENEIPAEF